MARPTYRTFVVERHVAVERPAVWDELVELIDSGLVRDGGVGQELLLSFEPPWRRVGRFELPPLGAVDHTVALRDDGDETHIVWAYVAEWAFADPADARSSAAEAVLARLQDAISTWADALVSTAGREAVLAHRERHEDEQQAE